MIYHVDEIELMMKIQERIMLSFDFILTIFKKKAIGAYRSNSDLLNFFLNSQIQIFQFSLKIGSKIVKLDQN